MALRSPESPKVDGLSLPIKTQKKLLPNQAGYKRGTPAAPRKSQFYHSKKGATSSLIKHQNIYASKEADIDSQDFDDFEFDDNLQEESKGSESNALITRKGASKGSFFGRSLEDYNFPEETEF